MAPSKPTKKSVSTTKFSSTKTNATVKKVASSSFGAPSQHNQASRKGKRAWRKNVDIQDVEEGLEGLRAEERVTGTFLHKKQNNELFQIDVKGDDQVRKALPRFSTAQLTSTKILAQRSAVPAVFSRLSSTDNRKAKSGLTRDEKSRLIRIGKRLRRGPLNSVMDPTEFGAGSAILEVSEAAKKSGGYDPWAEDNQVKGETDGFEPPKQPPIKRPTLAHPKDVIELPAITEPHEGTSYNPTASAHQELLLKAHEIEERRVKEENRLAEAKKKIEEARAEEPEHVVEGCPPGMIVDKIQADETDDDVEDAREPKKVMARKTKAQRNKAARLLAEKRSLAEKVAKKRMLATISSAKMLRQTIDHALTSREEARAQRQVELREKLKLGLLGQKLGKHKVQPGEVDVQLGEELSESLRALKPEGNLFRDRFLSLQHRALVEPRVPVLPKRRTTRLKEYEKHAWKRFE